VYARINSHNSWSHPIAAVTKLLGSIGAFATVLWATTPGGAETGFDAGPLRW